MSTFIGNHDLPRSVQYAGQTIPSWLGSNAQGAATTNGSGNAWTNEPTAETDPNTYERLANAFAVLFTTLGAPLIYYGDEIGMPGAGDPDNRRMMQWSGNTAAQQGLHDRIAALTAIRAAHPAMRRGTRTTLDVSADLWVYELSTTAGDPDPDTVYVAINRSDGDLTTTALPSGADGAHHEHAGGRVARDDSGAADAGVRVAATDGWRCDHSGWRCDHDGRTFDHSGRTFDHSGRTGDHSGRTFDHARWSSRRDEWSIRRDERTFHSHGCASRRPHRSTDGTR